MVLKQNFIFFLALINFLALQGMEISKVSSGETLTKQAGLYVDTFNPAEIEILKNSENNRDLMLDEPLSFWADFFHFHFNIFHLIAILFILILFYYTRKLKIQLQRTRSKLRTQNSRLNKRLDQLTYDHRELKKMLKDYVDIPDN